jgi:hypothetical protein
LARWHRIFSQRGIELSTYNPRSLLAERLPVSTRPSEE